MARWSARFLLAYAIEETAGFLGPLAVHPDMQGQGVGAGLDANALARLMKTVCFHAFGRRFAYYKKWFCRSPLRQAAGRLTRNVCWCAARPSLRRSVGHGSTRAELC